MKVARFLAPALLFGALCAAQGDSVNPPAPPPLPAGWQGKLAALLPEVAEQATLLQWRPSLSTVQLQLLVARAGGSPEALQDVIVSASKGVKAPYDERLGISEEQYRNYLVFQSVLTSTGKTLKLPVLRDATHLTFGDSAPLNGVLKGLTIDLKNGELRVPEGYTARPVGLVSSAAPDRTLDIKSGFQWTVMGSNATIGNGVRGTLTLLQLSGGQVVLSYKRTSILRFQVSTGEVIVGYSR